ncbi:MAG: tRNA (adenine-N1)-methyltransferase [Actinobacteria bacterium]|nr:tRNA (adenine-N1)-methyltransferase [Actinomycetota bacterium]
MHRGPRLAAGEIVHLLDPRGNKYTITLESGKALHTHRGQIDHDSLIGNPPGVTVLSTKDVEFLVMRPHLDDYVLGMPRGAAVVYPKDAARIVALADVGDGSSIIEAGAGSGALTCYLVRAAGTHGRVLSIEARADFAEIATENVRRWFGGTPRTWSIEVGPFQELALGVAPESVDAVVLDMLAPWECLSAADVVLVPGGALVVYVATTTQMSRVVEEMRASGRWVEPRAEELMLRTWHLDGLAVRPDHRMNGHTGFLVSTRRMAAHASPPRRHRRPAPGAYGSDYSGPGATESTGD